MGWIEFTEDRPGLLSAAETDDAVLVSVAGKLCNRTDYTVSMQEQRKAERLLVEQLSGVPQNAMHFLNQVHGNRIHIVNANADPSALFTAEADALVCLRKKTALVIRTADCCAVLYSAPSGIAAAHSGWRGTCENIAAKTLSALCDHTGTEASSVQVWLMPCIGPASYQIQEDVAVHFPRHVRQTGNGLYLDLQAAIAQQLLDAGLPEQNLYRSRMDTYRDTTLFYSHRRGDQGRNLNIIRRE